MERAGALVAIVESSREIADILGMVMEGEGFRVSIERHDQLERPGYLRRFLESGDPAVFLWDIPPPLSHNWEILRQVRAAAPHQRFVVTSTNKVALEKLGLSGGITLLAKPFDLDELLRAVHLAAERFVPASAVEQLRPTA